jgi:hypothetical protein
MPRESVRWQRFFARAMSLRTEGTGMLRNYETALLKKAAASKKE